MGEFDKLTRALNRAGISEDKISAILEGGLINDTDMAEQVVTGMPGISGEKYVFLNFENLNEEEAGKLFEAWGEFDKLEAALEQAGISEDKISAILEWGLINDTDMLDVIGGGEKYVFLNFENLTEEEADKLYDAWMSQKAGGKLKRRRRRKSKRKKSNRKRKKNTRRRSKKA